MAAYLLLTDNDRKRRPNRVKYTPLPKPEYDLLAPTYYIHIKIPQQIHDHSEGRSIIRAEGKPIRDVEKPGIKSHFTSTRLIDRDLRKTRHAVKAEAERRGDRIPEEAEIQAMHQLSLQGKRAVREACIHPEGPGLICHVPADALQFRIESKVTESGGVVATLFAVLKGEDVMLGYSNGENHIAAMGKLATGAAENESAYSQTAFPSVSITNSKDGQ